MAMASDLVRAEVIDAEEFPALSQRHNIGPVPNTLVNYRPGYVGAAPESYALERILNAP
jgi:hypothetical protein